MSFWDSINKELKKAVGEGIDVIKAAAEKSEDVANHSKARFRLHTLHKEAEESLKNLGGLVYDMSTPPHENPLENTEVQRLIKNIQDLEEETSRLEHKLTDTSPRRPPKGAAPAEFEMPATLAPKPEPIAAAPSEKPAAKKTATKKKAAPKKSPAKKKAAPKTEKKAVKKTTKKAALRKPATKKAAEKKPPVKKATPKKSTAAKAKKATTKKPAAKKAVKKPAAKETATAVEKKDSIAVAPKVLAATASGTEKKTEGTDKK